MSNLSTVEKHLQVIEHLKERYVLSGQERAMLDKIKTQIINCVAFTTDGGFDAETDEFFPEEVSGKYKIRIRYQKDDSKPEKTIYLKLIT